LVYGADCTAGALGQRTRGQTMAHKKLMLVLLFLTAGTLTAQQPMAKQAKVTPLMSRDLAVHTGQGSFGHYRGVCARRIGPYPPAQRTWVHLCAGGDHRDAGEGWKTSHADTRANFL